MEITIMENAYKIWVLALSMASLLIIEMLQQRAEMVTLKDMGLMDVKGIRRSIRRFSMS